ncbi:hypothetical protein ZEAMMB73_Zm00001d040366 [Zea mays]|uniref:Uncharacterized protein n=1 Tax=Zea mays TaxID=4577 RepID=A0A1D6MQD9_MAIZE|nr:hypothetical protein ZEAMMB73_Zm00001d040366 [Zea mays]
MARSAIRRAVLAAPILKPSLSLAVSHSHPRPASRSVTVPFISAAFCWQSPTCMYQLLLSSLFQPLIVIHLIMKAVLLIFFQTHLIGNVFEYKEQGSPRSDLVVEFCKDVQKRSQEGYLEFGRFVSPHSFLTGSGPIDYIQKMHNGDLVHCETTFHKMGRTAQVNIICGHCSNKVCKDEQGCICNISYHERMCRVIVELAIRCVKSGPRVFKGFTVGFHPRSSEIVYNGFTQPGFEQPHHGFRM